MHRDPNDKALAAQLQEFVPYDGISENSSSKGLTYRQTWRPKRRTEDILTEMINAKNRRHKIDQTAPKVPIKKRGQRERRRRSPKILVANH